MVGHVRNTVEKEIGPFLDALIPNGHALPWVIGFYQRHIRDIVHKIIEKEIFQTENNKKLPLAIALVILKSYFTDKTLDFRLLPLKRFVRSADLIGRQLDNALFVAIVQKKQGTSRTIFLPRNAVNLIESLVFIEILLYMRKRLCNLSFVEYQSLKPWIDKELHHRSPVSYSKNTVVPETCFIATPDDIMPPHPIWYFFNGERRFVLFLRREWLNILSIVYTAYDWMHVLKYHKTHHAIHVLWLMPLAAMQFLGQLLNLALIFYRLLRTILNEINNAIFIGLRIAFELLLKNRDINQNFLYLSAMTVAILLYSSVLFFVGVPFFLNSILVLEATYGYVPILIASALSVYSALIGLGAIFLTWRERCGRSLMESPKERQETKEIKYKNLDRVLKDNKHKNINNVDTPIKFPKLSYIVSPRKKKRPI